MVSNLTNQFADLLPIPECRRDMAAREGLTPSRGSALLSSQPGWGVRCACSHPRVRKRALRREPRQQRAASQGCSGNETRHSGLSCPAPALPSLQSPSSSASQGPSDALTLGLPILRGWLRLWPLWPSGIPSPPSLLPLAPGAGLGSPASLLLPGGDSWGAHELPIPGWRAPGVARRGVWLCWCSLELPTPSFLLEAEGLEADGWPGLGTGLQVPSGRAPQALSAGCLRGVSFVVIFKHNYFKEGMWFPHTQFENKTASGGESVLYARPPLRTCWDRAELSGLLFCCFQKVVSY